jgi:hypothetical protein
MSMQQRTLTEFGDGVIAVRMHRNDRNETVRILLAHLPDVLVRHVQSRFLNRSPACRPMHPSIHAFNTLRRSKSATSRRQRSSRLRCARHRAPAESADPIDCCTRTHSIEFDPLSTSAPWRSADRRGTNGRMPRMRPQRCVTKSLSQVASFCTPAALMNTWYLMRLIGCQSGLCITGFRYNPAIAPESITQPNQSAPTFRCEQPGSTLALLLTISAQMRVIVKHLVHALCTADGTHRSAHANELRAKRLAEPSQQKPHRRLPQ